MQPSGNVYFLINPAFDENEHLKELVGELGAAKAQWIGDWSHFGIKSPTGEIATIIFDAIKESPKMAMTAAKLGDTLDVSAYNNAAVTKYEFLVAESETLETQKGLQLPPSLMLVGQVCPPPPLFVRLLRS